MKRPLALSCLATAGVLLLGCGSEDSDPPPVAPALMMPGNGMGGTSATGVPDPSPTAPGDSMTTTGDSTSTTPAANEGQGEGIGLDMVDPPATNPMNDTGGMAAGGAPGMMDGMGGMGPVPVPELTLEDLVGPLDGHLFVVPCGDTPNTDDCNGFGWTSTFQDPGVNHVCVGNPQRLDAVINFPIGGEPGTVYNVDMHFYGVMEPREYANVTREAGGGTPSRESGGTPTPFATLNTPGATNYLAGDNNYNTYELHVLNQNGQEVATYFLNADAGTGHYTLAIDYGKTLQLIGGGTLRLQIADANCRQIKNCGTNQGTPCAPKARSIDISEADPQPPANSLQQPGLGRDPEHSGQWFLLDVLDFAEAAP